MTQPTSNSWATPLAARPCAPCASRYRTALGWVSGAEELPWKDPS